MLFDVMTLALMLQAGIVGAGGNTGAVCFGLAFRQLGYKRGFIVMGCIVMGSSVLSVLISIKGASGMLCGHDEEADFQSSILSPSMSLADREIDSRDSEVEGDENGIDGAFSY